MLVVVALQHFLFQRLQPRTGKGVVFPHPKVLKLTAQPLHRDPKRDIFKITVPRFQ